MMKESHNALMEMKAPLLADQIRREYQAMPGLKLTVQQACRLWGAAERDCRDALQFLVRQQFLTRVWDGSFALPRGMSTHERFALHRDPQPAPTN